MGGLDEPAVLSLFESCSNALRWGADDEKGTLNYITPRVTLAAVRSIRSGHVVSIGKDLPVGPAEIRSSARHEMIPDEQGLAALDRVCIDTHGFHHTHIDAIGHTSFEGRLYNGRNAADHVTAHGLTFGSVLAMANGVLTRGVLLDVAAARGVAYLEPGDGVTGEDLTLAARHAGAPIKRGDAVIVRTGRDRRQGDGRSESHGEREGLLPDAVEWLHRSEVAVYGGDCIERLPSGYSRVPQPLHQVGHCSIGLTLLDIVDTEALAAACATHETYTFALVIAPLRIPGGTGSPVNPLAVF